MRTSKVLKFWTLASPYFLICCFLFHFRLYYGILLLLMNFIFIYKNKSEDYRKKLLEFRKQLDYNCFDNLIDEMLINNSKL